MEGLLHICDFVCQDDEGKEITKPKILPSNLGILRMIRDDALHQMMDLKLLELTKVENSNDAWTSYYPPVISAITDEQQAKQVHMISDRDISSQRYLINLYLEAYSDDINKVKISKNIRAAERVLNSLYDIFNDVYLPMLVTNKHGYLNSDDNMTSALSIFVEKRNKSGMVNRRNHLQVNVFQKQEKESSHLRMSQKMLLQFLLADVANNHAEQTIRTIREGDDIIEELNMRNCPPLLAALVYARICGDIECQRQLIDMLCIGKAANITRDNIQLFMPVDVSNFNYVFKEDMHVLNSSDMKTGYVMKFGTPREIENMIVPADHIFYAIYELNGNYIVIYKKLEEVKSRNEFSCVRGVIVTAKNDSGVSRTVRMLLNKSFKLTIGDIIDQRRDISDVNDEEIVDMFRQSAIKTGLSLYSRIFKKKYELFTLLAEYIMDMGAQVVDKRLLNDETLCTIVRESYTYDNNTVDVSTTADDASRALMMTAMSYYIAEKINYESN